MARYAYFDLATGRVYDWLDTDAFSVNLPSPETLHEATEAEWEARAGGPWMVKDGAVVPWDDPPLSLEAARTLKSAELYAACESAILGGFMSDALGAPHQYPAALKDQINLLGSVTASTLPGVGEGWTTPFWCADASAVWDLREHTAAQIQAAGEAGKSWVVACQTQLDGLVRQLALAADAAAVAALVWE